MKIGYDSSAPVVSAAELAGVTRVLFVTTLAIGDFVAMQNCFVAFKKAFPWITVDIWVDEVRRSWKPWQVKKIKRSILQDWLIATGLFGTIYDQNHSWGMFADSLYTVQQQAYPLVVVFAHARSYRYARFARWMSPKGLIVGIQPEERRCYMRHFAHMDRRLIVNYPQDKTNGKHISSMYAEWFYRLFGVIGDTMPFVTIPKEWTTYSALKLLSWGITPSQREHRFVIFLNYTAKSSNRCWPLKYVIQLINELRPALAGEKKPFFVINTLPFDIQKAQALLSVEKGSDVILFSARENFFQLPAVMKQADVVISVDTAIIHLAAALKKPVVALMRRKNTEWHPYHKAQRLVINPPGRYWVKHIPVSVVLEGVKHFIANLPTHEKVSVVPSPQPESVASL